MFRPTCCPYRSCARHLDPQPRFCVRFGSFKPNCRPSPVPRFRCKSCRRTFSRQTFRADFRDRKPHLNALLFGFITSGVGIRQSARRIGLSLRCTELKLRKMGRHLRRLNLNLRKGLEAGGKRAFTSTNSRPMKSDEMPGRSAFPVLIESESRFIVWAESAPIRPRGTMTTNRLKAIQESERRHGIRKDTSRRSVRRTLKRGADLAARSGSIVLQTDEKSSYPGIARRVFGSPRLIHVKTNSKLVV